MLFLLFLLEVWACCLANFFACFLRFHAGSKSIPQCCSL